MIASVLTLEMNDLQRLGKQLDEYGIHKLVYSHFPGKNRQFLYLDKGGRFNERCILMLSQNMPESTGMGRLQNKEVPSEYLKQEVYAFEVRLNPVTRLSGSKICTAVKGRNKLVQWFLNHQQNWGFMTEIDKLDVFDIGVQQFLKQDQMITHNKATFRGILKITDREKFIKSFEKGIGRGKAFGFGLLQIRPIRA